MCAVARDNLERPSERFLADGIGGFVGVDKGESSYYLLWWSLYILYQGILGSALG